MTELICTYTLRRNGLALFTSEPMPESQVFAELAKTVDAGMVVDIEEWEPYQGECDDLEWELQQEERGNRALSSDHYAGF